MPIEPRRNRHPIATAAQLLALAGCVAGLLLLWASSASAETVPLGSKQDTSSYPSVFFAPATLERAESFVVSLSAEPAQSFQYQHYISCTHGSESVSFQSPEQPVTPPFSTTVLPTVPEPDSCWIDVSAEAPFKTAVPGTVRIEVTGNRRPAPPPVLVPAPLPVPVWVTCSPPNFLKSGQTKAHGESCGTAQTIATKAWHKPARAGNSVTARGFSCRRSQRGTSVRIRCTKGTAIVLVTGHLR